MDGIDNLKKKIDLLLEIVARLTKKAERLEKEVKNHSLRLRIVEEKVNDFEKAIK